ncbi:MULTISPECIES: alpha/beta fold hydrolase [Actinosynnema]|uniref:alpha/beta fold hydrolase n=1 Tax=Actinosynnema TaxID=40566 RepID=UPI0020A24C1B|nr:alpha/beta hydrolase [Actinosynnema pretiosum]MCP2092600.1 Pimeloyl-ACP methyl ester carboxylesterase [Actinosynnema pretiosum]
MPTITTNDGVDLHVTDEGTGSPVVLVAGYGAPATSWAFQTEALLAMGHRVLGFDRRWHGESARPPHGHRLSRHGKDLHDALVALDLRDAVLVGGSMGAGTIWACLSLFGADRVRGVVSVDQTPKMINSADWPYGFYGLTEQNSGDFFAKGVPKTGRGYSAAKSLKSAARLVKKAGMGAVPNDPGKETWPLLHDHAHQDWRDVVQRCDVPVLMLAGRDSQLWPWQHAEAAVTGNPNGRAVVIDDCGHGANFDQPDRVNAEILAFLGDL